MSDTIFSTVQRYKISGDFFDVSPTGCKFVIRNPDTAPAPHTAVKFQHHPHRCCCPSELKGWRVDHKIVFDKDFAAWICVLWPDGMRENPSKIGAADLKSRGMVFQSWLDTAFYIVGCKKALGFDVPCDGDDLPVVELVVHDGDDSEWYELRGVEE